MPTTEGYNGAYTGQEIDAGIAKANAALPAPTGGTAGQVLKKTETGTEWGNVDGGPKSRTVTLSSSAWSDNSQTVTVNGVVADETKQLIQPMPAVASQTAYMSAGIYCSGQAANSLTFTCSETPTEDIALYIVITEVGA